MEQFNLDKWLQDKSRKVVTRDGRPVRIVCWDKKDSKYPIVGLVYNENGLEEKEGCCSFKINGKAWGDACYDLFFADEERLSEFEKELINIVFKYKYWSNNKDEVKQYIKTDSKKLLDLARKELQPEFDKELEKAYKTQDDAVYRNGYAQGKQDVLKAALESLPKWKKSSEQKDFNYFVARLEDNRRVVIISEVLKGDYYIELNDLKTLPKEE